MSCDDSFGLAVSWRARRTKLLRMYTGAHPCDSEISHRLVPDISTGQGLQGGEQFVDAWVQRIGIHLAKADDALGVEDEERTSAHTFRLAIHAILPCGQPTRLEIGKERKADLRIMREGFMAVDMVGGDAE